MSSDRVQIPFSFSYPVTGFISTSSTTFSGGTSESVTMMVAAVGAPITIINRDTSSPATIWQAESGASFYSSISTDSGGNVPGWLDAGSYKITAGPVGGFSGSTINFDPSRGDGTTLIAPGAVNTAAISANAVTSSLLATSVSQALVPTGTILEFGGSGAPSGFVACDGSIYATGTSGSTYHALSSTLGTTWNTGGEGTGNFRVPDLRGLVSVGAGSGSGLTVRALGPRLASPNGGEEKHTLSSGEMPGHNHTISDPGHGHGVFDPGHTHSTSYANASSVNASGTWVAPGLGPSQTGASATGISIDAGVTGISLSATGGSATHNNMQPFAATNKIIKL